MRRITQKERQIRREEIIEKARIGVSRKNLAKEYDYSIKYINDICREAGIESPQFIYIPNSKPGSLKIIAELQNTDYLMSDIAERLNISRVRVSQIYQQCLKAGIKFPNRRTK